MIALQAISHRFKSGWAYSIKMKKRIFSKTFHFFCFLFSPFFFQALKKLSLKTSKERQFHLLLFFYSFFLFYQGPCSSIKASLKVHELWQHKGRKCSFQFYFLWLWKESFIQKIWLSIWKKESQIKEKILKRVFKKVWKKNFFW